MVHRIVMINCLLPWKCEDAADCAGSGRKCKFRQSSRVQVRILMTYNGSHVMNMTRGRPWGAGRRLRFSSWIRELLHFCVDCWVLWSFSSSLSARYVGLSFMIFVRLGLGGVLAFGWWKSRQTSTTLSVSQLGSLGARQQDRSCSATWLRRQLGGWINYFSHPIE